MVNSGFADVPKSTSSEKVSPRESGVCLALISGCARAFIRSGSSTIFTAGLVTYFSNAEVRGLGLAETESTSALRLSVILMVGMVLSSKCSRPSAHSVAGTDDSVNGGQKGTTRPKDQTEGGEWSSVYSRILNLMILLA